MLDLLIILIIAGFFIFKNLKQLKRDNHKKDFWNSFSANNSDQNKNDFNDYVNPNKIKEKFNNFLNSTFNGGESKNNKNFSPEKILMVAFAVIIFGWGLSGFYIVQPDEEGVETFLGKYSKTTISGLHYRLPSPITKIYKIKTTRVNTEEIGYRASSGNSDDSLVLIESTMVTKDENIIDVNFDVQWRVVDAAKFVFNIKAGDIASTIKFASESVMRDLIGRNNMAFALGEGRATLAEQARIALQKILDEYSLGISILSIPIKKIDPPKQVIASFRDVQSARSDKEREINMALAYKNDIIPRARGEAAKIINESEAYSHSVLNKARGDVAKMNSLYPLYKQNKELVRTKLYTELLNDIFPNMKKVILPNNSASGSGQVNFLNLGEMLKDIDKKSLKENN